MFGIVVVLLFRVN